MIENSPSYIKGFWKKDVGFLPEFHQYSGVAWTLDDTQIEG